MKIIKLTETQLSNMIKNLNENIIMEESDYNPDKLYDTEYIISILKASFSSNIS